jgi:hypothetical protein
LASVRSRSFAWAITLAMGLSGCESSFERGAGEPTLTLTPCSGGGLSEAQCGTLTVPEDRAAPEGRQIELAIVVVPASSRGAARDLTGPRRALDPSPG